VNEGLACRGRAWHGRRGRRGRCSRRDLKQRVNPAGMHPPIEAVGRLGIDRIGVQNQAPERRLDMPARAAKPVVEIEVTEGGIEVVAPKQADNAPAEPDAFRITGGPIQDMLSFGELIDFLRFLGGVFGRRGLFVGWFGVVVLGEGRGLHRADRGRKQPEGGGAEGAGKVKHALRHHCLVSLVGT